MSEIRISFDVPSYLIVHYYITGISSLILNLFVVYLIVYHSGKLDSYRFYLLAFQISCTLSDLHISIVAQPIGFFPIPAGYGYGIGHYFISSHTGSTIFSFLLSGQIEVLTICFFRKHKAITNLANPLGSSSAVYLCIYAINIPYCIYVHANSLDLQFNCCRVDLSRVSKEIIFLEKEVNEYNFGQGFVASKFKQ
ncbi:hypothetical protein GCK72_020457 [Caenorhabditis remanei]|uniref:G protein-coupled receptor n=1 Tax=Caenorhabditis remanei TaxID=31234 RepID=A0A6A5GFJ9_CAERE|nr:hypothetical protein GCK72_020457 [Caenorhabditis remanei]KAF1753900.1 hypothetical protein GCK72_020457 [Caenorhabditis remanei]